MEEAQNKKKNSNENGAAVWKSFCHMLRFLRKDKMLLAASLAPILAGVVIRFGLPALDRVLCEVFHRTALMEPFYGMVDCFYVMLASTMLCFSAVMIVLEEQDDHILAYLSVSPLTSVGYFWSRFVLPAFFSLMVTLILFPLFKMSDVSGVWMVFMPLAGTTQGMIVAMVVFLLAKNKLEGMAVTKLSTVVLLGVIAPYAIAGWEQYLLAFLPSFWMGKAMVTENVSLLLVSLVESAVWVLLLWKIKKKTAIK